ncbi:MAG: hypothetical protein ACYTFV_15375 [Planctomycetota bacterium]|jgi:hypothetical protein
MNRPLLAGLILLLLLAGLVFWPRPEIDRGSARRPELADGAADTSNAEALEARSSDEAVADPQELRAALDATEQPTADPGSHPTWVFSDGRPYVPETWFYVVDGAPTAPGAGPPQGGSTIEVAAIDAEGFPWIGATGPGPFTEPIVIDDYIDVRASVERYPGGTQDDLEIWCVSWGSKGWIRQIDYMGWERLDSRVEQVAEILAVAPDKAAEAWRKQFPSMGANLKPLLAVQGAGGETRRLPRPSESVIFFMKPGSRGWNFVYPDPEWVKQPARWASDAARADRDETRKIPVAKGEAIDLQVLAWGPVTIAGRLEEPPLDGSLAALEGDYRVTVRELELLEDRIVRRDELETEVSGPDFRVEGLRPGDKALVLAREVAPNHVRAYASRVGPIASGAEWDVGLLELHPWTVTATVAFRDAEGQPLGDDLLTELEGCAAPGRLLWHTEDALTLDWEFQWTHGATMHFEGLREARTFFKLGSAEFELSDGRKASVAGEFDGQVFQLRPKGERSWTPTFEYRVTLSDPPR